MPPLILWALGAAAVAMLGRVLYRESQRINSELHPEPRGAERGERGDKLERDPNTGIYRPK